MTKTFELNNLNSVISCKNDVHNAVYCCSKLSQVLFTRHLVSMISKFGVTINCLCPGPVKTDLLREANFKVKIITACIAPFFKNAKQGAQTTIHLAVADEVADITGEYFTDCKITKTSPMAMDVGLAKKLWDISETLVNLKAEERNY